MNRKLLLAPAAAVAALLLLAGCAPAEEPTPTNTATVEPAPAPSDSVDTGDVGTQLPTDGDIDPAIGISGDGMTLEPEGFPAGIPLYGGSVMIETYMNDGSVVDLAFTGTPEDVMNLLPAFEANGFVISGSDVLINAAAPAYNIAIITDETQLPAGAAYAYKIFLN